MSVDRIAGDRATEGHDDRELAEDLEPADETARDVTGGSPSVSDMTITKPIDKPSPLKP